MQDDISRDLESLRRRRGSRANIDMLADAIDRHDPDLSKIRERIAKSFEEAKKESEGESKT